MAGTVQPSMTAPTSITPIKRILEEEGRSQRWLAERAGIHESWMSLIVNRGWKPSEDDAQKIADVLGRDINELWPAVAA